MLLCEKAVNPHCGQANFMKCTIGGITGKIECDPSIGGTSTPGGSSPGAPTQIHNWGDNYGERSEPKNIFARGGG
jgi:hypothetical protein